MLGIAGMVLYGSLCSRVTAAAGVNPSSRHRMLHPCAVHTCRIDGQRAWPHRTLLHMLQCIRRLPGIWAPPREPVPHRFTKISESKMALKVDWHLPIHIKVRARQATPTHPSSLPVACLLPVAALDCGETQARGAKHAHYWHHISFAPYPVLSNS